MERMGPVWRGVLGGIGIVVGLLVGALVVAAVIYGYTTTITRDVRHPIALRRSLCAYLCDHATYRIRNDTGQSVLLARCDDHCGVGDGEGRPFDIAPGNAIRIRLPGL